MTTGEETVPVVGALVPEQVLTTRELQRQQRERRQAAISESFLSAADAVLDNVAGSSLLLLFVGGCTHTFSTLLLITKQMFDPGTPVVACVSTHVFVQATQVLVLVACVVLGNSALTYDFLGTTNQAVQPKRLFLLLVIGLVEALIVLPLVAPLLVADAPPLAPAFCHVDHRLPAGAERHVVVGVLHTHVVFATATFVVGLSGSIFFLILMGLASNRPLLLIVPIATFMGAFVVVYLCYYVHFGRRVENAVVGAVAVGDRCIADVVTAVLDAVQGPERDADKLVGMYGPSVQWSLEPYACRPNLLCRVLAGVLVASTTLLVTFAA